MYSDEHIGKTYYIIIFHILIFIALTEFAATVLYYLYIYHLQKIKQVKSFIMKINDKWLKYSNKFKVMPTPPPPNTEPRGDYEQLQEELLLADPAQ